MSNLISKKNKKVGVKIASTPTTPGTWGVAAEPGVNDGFFVTSLSNPAGDRETVVHENEAGRGQASHAEVLGFQAQNGSLEVKSYVEGIEPLMAQVMGAESNPEEVVTGAVYKKSFQLADTVENTFSTIAWDEGTEIACVPSAVISEWGMKIDNVLTHSFSFMGCSLEKPTWSTPLGVTYEYSGAKSHKLINCSVYLNDYGSADFTSSDLVSVTNVSISIKRGYNFDGREAGSEILSIPTDSQEPVVTMTLNFPKKDAKNQTFWADFGSGKEKKCKIVFDAGQIGGTPQNYLFSIFLPKLFIDGAPSYGFDSPTPVELKFRHLKAESLPTGMTHLTPYIEIQNSINKKYL